DADIAGHRELRGGTGRADADVAVVEDGQAPGVTVVEADLIGGMAADEPVARDPQAAVVVVRLQAAVDPEVDVYPPAAGHRELRGGTGCADADVAVPADEQPRRAVHVALMRPDVQAVAGRRALVVLDRVPVVLLPDPHLEPAAVLVAPGHLERQIPVPRLEVADLQIVRRPGRADADVAVDGQRAAQPDLAGRGRAQRRRVRGGPREAHAGGLPLAQVDGYPTLVVQGQL